MQSLALYIHIPFCHAICSYCDFNVYAGLSRLMPAFAQALAREIRVVGAGRGLPVHSIFFGGGTPSAMPAALIGDILSVCRESFDIAADAEITLEANPDRLERAEVAAWRALGINRVSFGAQSAQPSELRLFRRTHTFADVATAVQIAREASFDNISLDLIYGIPDQTLDAWRDTLAQSLALAPDHLSLYSLTVEEGTPLSRWVARGQTPAPDPDRAADMYEWAQNALAAAGFAHYEIANWARPGKESRHNLTYWRNAPYLGFGPGAHGSYGGWRYWTVLRPQDYIARLDAADATPDFPFSPALDGRESIDRALEMGETMMLGLRLIREGIAFNRFRERFGLDARDVYVGEIAELEALDLLERDADRLRLTRRGRALGNEVFAAFLPPS
jgi:oxygen-independent coproporphyrinogen-3 oxidase